MEVCKPKGLPKCPTSVSTDSYKPSIADNKSKIVFVSCESEDDTIGAIKSKSSPPA